jgi:hypothetical protein
MVKDGQVVRLRQLLRPSTTLKEIALQANMDTKTARKDIRLSTLPSENHRIREWRTRTDPLAGVWEEVAGQLQVIRRPQPRLSLAHYRSPINAARIEQEFADRGDLLPVAELVKCGRLRERKRALAIFAGLKGLRVSLVAECLQSSPKTVKRCGASFASDGPAALIVAKKRSVRGGGDAECGRFLFSLLHSPPSAHGISRSSWKMDDIHRILAENAHGISRQKIRAIHSRAKTTNEMIKMADLLRTQSHTCRTIYLSWDAASWHVSKRLCAYLDAVNRQALRSCPVIVF